ncbi:OmpA family protein [Archangium violaceum]|uniref:OmpA family protein n=1 Tax=Archangium violaceum TaxID=83451 RepID=UPI00193BA570|nr:OmpA family protein [Archangium violaceum]QRK11261.1 OmpA family protein [Archangium violaceum]
MRSRRMGSSTRRASSAAGLAALGVLSAPVARAQDSAAPLTQAIDVQRYKPGPGATDILGVHGARVEGHLGWHLGASLDYASNPLGFLDVRQDDFVYQVVAHQVTVDLMGSLSLWNRFELGVALPITYQSSERGAAITPAFAEGVSGAGVGDLRLVPKAHLYSRGALHLGLALPVLLPTAGGQGFRGGAGVAVRPQVVGEWAPASGVRVVANLGAQVRDELRLFNLRAGTELSLSVGARVPVGERLAVQAQVAGALGLARGSTEAPLEVLASVQYRVRDGLLAHVGGGPGLTRGYGTPGFRLFAGIDWTQPGERARLSRPLPPPAPLAMTPAPVAPLAPSSRPEDLLVTKVQNDCRDVAGSKARLGSTSIVVDEVYFDTAKDVILLESFDTLKQVAAVLKAHPEIHLLRVEGHTDDQGDDASNRDLSQRRADNVRAFLINEGIAANRLESVGYGETRPVDTNKTAKGRENNRRVEFNILKLAGTSIARSAPRG